jgi:peptide/nickel transport system permease protein
MEGQPGRESRRLPHHPMLRRLRSLFHAVSGQFKVIGTSKLGLLGLAGLAFFVALGVFAPYLAPYGPYENIVYPNGEPATLEPPSLAHPFGTTQMSHDVLSQLIWGTRRTLTIALAAAFASIFVGTNMGLVAGYYGGKTDNVLMRLTDIAYGIPFLPFAMVALMILGTQDIILIIVMASVGWRTSARIVRSQVLTLKERPFVSVARSLGASSFRIIYRHIAPNVLPLAVINSILFVGECALVEASVSFLGFGNPKSISWGQMLFYCFASARMRVAWWWSLMPGVAIMLLVLSVFFIGRSYEEVVNPRLREW